MTEAITEFRGKNRWLSNFHAAPIIEDMIVYPTTEHYYQSKKSRHVEDRNAIIACKTPAEAMRMGRSLADPIPEGEWSKLKIPVMFKANLLKYTQHPYLMDLLLATGEAELVEGNYWNDTYWGQCPIGNGQNNLGMVLMQVRDVLRYGTEGILED